VRPSHNQAVQRHHLLRGTNDLESTLESARVTQAAVPGTPWVELEFVESVVSA
jgi:hypothetical protein